MKKIKFAITINCLKINLVASIIVARSRINKYDFNKKITMSIATKIRNLRILK